jgi:asparagine synthase (glutamine-hydrolysing)
MCGIAGIYEPEGRLADAPLLLRMAGELSHRGPDGVGLYLDNRLGMVNTRLAIVDLEGGDQPLSNENKQLWVMQNGEIFNGIELKAELEAHGHRFATNCDTEVLVHAYEQWGAACLHRLNGEFAFAIWDVAKRELFLARDRFGIRPLFLANVDGSLLFASEAKALLRHPRIDRSIDPAGLVETFTLWATSPDRAVLGEVRELPPGHFLFCQANGRVTQSRWWDLDFSACQANVNADENDLRDELFALLRDATQIRLRADVPVGAYLSGGLDSSTIATLARDLTGNPLRLFAVQFDDPAFDESRHQERMASELGIELSTIKVNGAEIAEAFPEVIRLSEKPLLRTAATPLLLLSRHVRKNGIKVVLTGEGADEIFAGYNIFRENKVRRFWARQPQSLRRPKLLDALYPYVRDLTTAAAFTRAFFGKHLTDTSDPLYSHRIRFDNTARILSLLHSDFIHRAAQTARDPKEDLIQRLPRTFAAVSPLGKAQYLEIVTFLEGYLLHSQGDRMLMGNSVEGRFPFLDYRLAEFAARLPDRNRIRGLKEKYLLRKAVAHLLPREIANREKRPFRAPIRHALLGPQAPDYVRELLSETQIACAGVFDAKQVQRLCVKCGSELNRVSETDEMALVGVLSTMLLHDMLVANPRVSAPAKPTKIVIGSKTLQLGLVA